MDNLLKDYPDEGEVDCQQIKVRKVTTELGKLREGHGVSFQVELEQEGARTLESATYSSTEWFLDVTSSPAMWYVFKETK